MQDQAANYCTSSQTLLKHNLDLNNLINSAKWFIHKKSWEVYSYSSRGKNRTILLIFGKGEFLFTILRIIQII